jgi:hypothetical protein
MTEVVNSPCELVT